MQKKRTRQLILGEGPILEEELIKPGTHARVAKEMMVAVRIGTLFRAI
jgi:hypothetical protein